MNPIPKPNPAPLIEELRAHLDLGAELLSLAHREHQALHAPGEFPASEFDQIRKVLLPRLKYSIECIGKSRQAWQQLSQAERARQVKVTNLVRANMDLIMKVLMLDRENEQMLLRRGLIPAQHLHRARHTHPHFVASLYRRNNGN
ncbi:MAG: hypothetical protein M1608_09700 [Candidatus Omnitrophica bacterium]|nr:hypothetical protein [Candidatus Omnitrophota bacterium]